MTRRTAAALLAAAVLCPAGHGAAQTTDPGAPDEQGAPAVVLDRVFRELFETLRPALKDALDYMRGFSGVDDPRHYELPEVLPNGDIIIRRRRDAPPFDARPEPGDSDGEPGIRT